jgi:hypothetical protein
MFVLCFGLHKVWFNRSAETVWVHEEKFFWMGLDNSFRCSQPFIGAGRPSS